MQNERELLDSPVKRTSPLKEYIVDYVGEKIQPVKDEVTVAMVIHVLADDFPEIILALAEENFFRGYQQGLDDAYQPPGEKKDDDIQ